MFHCDKCGATLLADCKCICVDLGYPPAVERSEYVSAGGLRVVLEVPEPMGSDGYLPPPVIEFWRGGPVPFTYQGDEPAGDKAAS